MSNIPSEPIHLKLSDAKLVRDSKIEEIAEFFNWHIIITCKNKNEIYLSSHECEYIRLNSISRILNFEINELQLSYQRGGIPKEQIIIDYTTLMYTGRSQAIVNYILNSFPNAEILQLDSHFECKNRKIENLNIWALPLRYSYTGCIIKDFGYTYVIRANDFAIANSIPPQYIYKEEKDCINHILKYKLFILHALNNNIHLVSSPLADPSLFTYINDIIPYRIEEEGR